MTESIGPFISASRRIDLIGQLAREHSERVSVNISRLITSGLQGDQKKDGKDGGKDVGEGGLWDKKDGKEGKDKEKDGKESKEGKEGKESKDGKDSKDGKEAKDGKEGKDSKDGKESKEGGKEGSKDGKDKDKDGKDKDDDAGKFTGSENQLVRYGQELVLPAESFEAIVELHSVRLTSLLNEPMF